jgi:tetratricopeptide (TPR) repeat protein
MRRSISQHITSAAVALAAAVTLLQGAAAAAPAAPEDSLASARDLYAAAAYEDALLVLNRLRAGGVLPGEAPVIEQYRAFCLLALGRSADAEQAIANLVTTDPLFEPSQEVSPRIRTAFADVRRRMLPGIVQNTYAVAKAAYDQKNFVAAAGGFRRVLEVLNDPDVAAAAAQPPLSDLKTLAAGFHDLSAAAAAPPPPPPPPPAPAPAPAPEAVQPAVPAPPRVYGIEDTSVVPPIAIKQALPPFPMRGAMPPHGAIEVVIDESGKVETAVMRIPLAAVYDRQAVNAARSWEYRPATLNGVPVKYRKVIQITVRP